jgi:protein gp37
MGAKTGIAWTGATWNFIRGCSKISPACGHCYAQELSHRFGWTSLPWTEANAAINVQMLPERLEIPTRWPEPKTIFVNSISDFFHTQVTDDFIAAAFAVMAATPRHTYQVLTKRAERLNSLLNSPSFWALVESHLAVRAAKAKGKAARTGQIDELTQAAMRTHHFLPNVYLGVTIENNRWAERARLLAATPAARRFISSEPLLGPIDAINLDWIDQLIVGGESGPGARRMDPAWVEGAQAQAHDAGAAFFFKQMGNALARERGLTGKGVDPTQWPALWRMRQSPIRLSADAAISRELCQSVSVGSQLRAHATGIEAADVRSSFRGLGGEPLDELSVW